MVVERDRHSKELAGGVGRFASACGQRRDLEVIRKRLQSRNVCLCRPSAIWIGADDPNTNPLVPTLASFHVLQPPLFDMKAWHFPLYGTIDKNGKHYCR